MNNGLPTYRDFFPSFITKGALGVYMASLLLITIFFSQWVMLWYWWAIGLVCVVAFFYGTPNLMRKWSRVSPKVFEKKLFWTGWLVRAVTAVLMYLLFQVLADGALDFEAADVIWYDKEGAYIADCFYDGQWNVVKSFHEFRGGRGDLSDSGYPIYLGIVYTLVAKSVLLARLVQSFFGAAMGVFVYRIAQRHFDEPTARMASIMTMLMPNLVMYCGLHLKEVVMTFLTMLFVERADDVTTNKNFKWDKLIVVGLSGLALFTFRTVLAATLFLAFAVTLVLSSSRIIKGGKRILLIIFSLIFVGIAFSGQIKSEVMYFIEKDVRAQQQTSMNLRYGAGRGDGQGNKFATYASAVVFAPMIFTLPFPTMVETLGQEQKRMLHGGCFVKNMMSGFVILAMFIFLLGGNLRSMEAEWRKHVLPLSVLCGYLVVLVFSEFAHSERFHHPILPLLMMFAAYGVTHMKPKWRWMFNVWCVVCVIICVGWAYIKVVGRGLL